MEREIRARAVTECVRFEHEVNPLGRIHQVEGAGVPEPAGPERSCTTLEMAPASHVEFVNHHAFIDIGDAHVQREMRLTESEMSEQRAARDASAINERE